MICLYMPFCALYLNFVLFSDAKYRHALTRSPYSNKRNGYFRFIAKLENPFNSRTHCVLFSFFTWFFISFRLMFNCISVFGLVLFVVVVVFLLLFVSSDGLHTGELYSGRFLWVCIVHSYRHQCDVFYP